MRYRLCFAPTLVPLLLDNAPDLARQKPNCQDFKRVSLLRQLRSHQWSIMGIGLACVRIHFLAEIARTRRQLPTSAESPADKHSDSLQ
jgi:hypothetical protein